MATPPVGNTDIVREFFEEVFNKGNLEAVDELVAEQHLFYAADRPEMEPKVGRKMLKGIVAVFLEIVPDVHVDYDGENGEMIAEGDKVVSRWAASGTLAGKLKAVGVRGVGVSGDEMKLSGISVFRISGGKIQETRQWLEVVVQDELPIIPEKVRNELLKNEQIREFLGDAQRDWIVCRMCRCC